MFEHRYCVPFDNCCDTVCVGHICSMLPEVSRSFLLSSGTTAVGRFTDIFFDFSLGADDIIAGRLRWILTCARIVHSATQNRAMYISSVRAEDGRFFLLRVKTPYYQQYLFLSNLSTSEIFFFFLPWAVLFANDDESQQAG